MFNNIFKSDLCYKGGTQHYFQPRYSEDSGPLEVKANMASANDIRSLIETMKSKKYVCDVCIWCGKVVNKND